MLLELILDKKQTAKYLNVSDRTIDYWMATKQIPHSRLSPRKVRFDSDRLDEWVKDKEVAMLNDEKSA